MEELADAAVYFYRSLEPAAELKAQHFTAEVKPAIVRFAAEACGDRMGEPRHHRSDQKLAPRHTVEAAQVAMPLRVMVTGETQTPSIDAVLELIGREETLKRMDQQLANFLNGVE